MKFQQVAPSEESVIWQYDAGHFSVVALAYAFGQYRLQVWHHQTGHYPDVMMPNF